MCRSIKPLFNFDPPASRDEIHDAALQFIRKISGYNTPPKANEAAFNQGVKEVTAAASKLIKSLTTSADPRNREIEAAKARARFASRS